MDSAQAWNIPERSDRSHRYHETENRVNLFLLLTGILYFLNIIDSVYLISPSPSMGMSQKPIRLQLIPSEYKFAERQIGTTTLNTDYSLDFRVMVSF